MVNFITSHIKTASIYIVLCFTIHMVTSAIMNYISYFFLKYFGILIMPFIVLIIISLEWASFGYFMNILFHEERKAVRKMLSLVLIFFLITLIIYIVTIKLNIYSYIANVRMVWDKSFDIIAFTLLRNKIDYVTYYTIMPILANISACFCIIGSFILGYRLSKVKG